MPDSIVALLGVFGLSLVVAVLVRMTARISPYHYFALYELVHGFDTFLTVQGALLRFGAPTVVCTIGLLPFGENQAWLGASVGFVSSFLLVWPPVSDRRLLPPSAVGREAQTYLVYAMFIASFTLFGLAGGLASNFVRPPIDELLSGSSARQAWEAAEGQLDDVLVELVVIAIAGIAAKSFIAGWKWITRTQ